MRKPVFCQCKKTKTDNQLMSTTFSRKKNLPELKFLFSAHCPMLVNNPMKFHHDILNAFLSY